MSPQPRRILAALGIAVASVAAVSPVVGFLEQATDIENASSAYLVAVVASAVAAGPAAGVASAVAAVAAYNLLFTEPRFTLLVHETADWLTLLLLLGVGTVVGELAGAQRSRAEAAARREREARTLAAASRALVATDSLPETLAAVSILLRDELDLARTWIGLIGADGIEATVADSGPGTGPVASDYLVLQRTGGTARWTRVRRPEQRRRAREAGIEPVYRIPIESAGRVLGGLWIVPQAGRGRLGTEEARLLAGVADGIASAVERDRLVREAMDAEVARRSDAVKTALLGAVSHDLRTPLTAIRTAAARLAEARDLPPTERMVAAAEIEALVERLDRLVSNLLDLSRIESGTLRPRLAPRILADVVADSLTRNGARFSGTPVVVDIPGALPPVAIDDVLFEQALANLLENAVRHAPGAMVRISGRIADGAVRLSVEDAGPGVSDAELPRLFERFSRPTRTGSRGRRAGSGLGLAVVKGFVEAMGGRAAARRSSLGGLAVDIDLPMAEPNQP
ncbi:MAG TPA: ATP-binding protein [Candidatus Binatia bacterium]|nr:ATP-binding protein [Candidatus Binatia bacterium]